MRSLFENWIMCMKIKLKLGKNILFKVIKINIEEDLIIIDKKDFVKFGEDEVE